MTTTEPLTPKQQYEARKAERAKLKTLLPQEQERSKNLMMLDAMDRFVTAVERIADALEIDPKRTTAAS